jgi:hypothetical protein
MSRRRTGILGSSNVPSTSAQAARMFGWGSASAMTRIRSSSSGSARPSTARTAFRRIWNVGLARPARMSSGERRSSPAATAVARRRRKMVRLMPEV